MKYSLCLAAASAVFVAAQSVDDLPQCGQTCINNMLGKAQQEFGCSNGDVDCYCAQPRFGFGVRDCANEACPDAQAAQTVISFGAQYCQSALASAMSSGMDSTPTASALSVLSSAIGGGAMTTGGNSNNTMATSVSSTDTVTSTVTSGAGAAGNSSATGAAGIIPIAGGSSGYSIGSQVFTAGGDATTVMGTAYSALPSGAGVVAIGDDMTTTLSGDALASVTGLAGGAAMTATDAAGNAASTVTSAGGDGASVVSSVGSSAGSAATGGAGNDSDSNDNNDGSDSDNTAGGAAAESTSDSSNTDSGAGAMATAAPGLLGAAAFALLML